MFQPAFGCAQHPKAGQNTQHMLLTFRAFKNNVLLTSNGRNTSLVIVVDICATGSSITRIEVGLHHRIVTCIRLKECGGSVMGQGQGTGTGCW